MANYIIDSLQFGSDKNVFTLPYGISSTAAGTAAKTVTVENFVLATGARIVVKFTVANTAASPTLNVNSTGAKPIYYKGAAINASHITANGTFEFIYNGTQWDLIGDNSSKTSEASHADEADKATSDKNGNIIHETYAPIKSPIFTGIPQAPTAADGTNTTQIATTAFVQKAVANLVDSAPEDLDTLNELAAALGDDPNFAATTIGLIGNKVDQKDFDAHVETIASSSVLGHIKVGYATSDKNYAVKVDADGDAYVNVPWTDNNDNTTYDLGTASGGVIQLVGSDSNTDKVTLSGAGKVSVSTTSTTAGAGTIKIDGSELVNYVDEQIGLQTDENVIADDITSETAGIYSIALAPNGSNAAHIKRSGEDLTFDTVSGELSANDFVANDISLTYLASLLTWHE